MPAIFRTDSGIFGDIEASNMIVTGEVKVGPSQTTIDEYISAEVNTVVGSGINYSAEIATVSGQVDVVSGDLVTTNNTLNTATGNIDTISGAVQGILEAEVADDTAFNTVSGRVDAVSGDLNTLSSTVDRGLIL